MHKPLHFPKDKMRFGFTEVDGQQTSICRAVNGAVSTTIGAGIETLEKTRIEWTVTYDEVLFIHDGRITIRFGDRSFDCVPGDIVWLPNGTTLIYDAPERCTYFYALYPVDWAARQGTKEP
jgi:ethanolamine utilization protein EutQ